jgi:hypothetical protein
MPVDDGFWKEKNNKYINKKVEILLNPTKSALRKSRDSRNKKGHLVNSIKHSFYQWVVQWELWFYFLRRWHWRQFRPLSTPLKILSALLWQGEQKTVLWEVVTMKNLRAIIERRNCLQCTHAWHLSVAVPLWPHDVVLLRRLRHACSVDETWVAGFLRPGHDEQRTQSLNIEKLHHEGESSSSYKSCFHWSQRKFLKNEWSITLR